MVDSGTDEDLVEAIMERGLGADESGRWFNSLTEDDLVEPAKQALSEEKADDGISWFREPDIRVRPRGANEPSGRVSEEPDLVGVIETQSSSIYYVAELKTEVNKKAFGQILNYYWAFQEGDKLVKGDTVHELPENPPIFAAIVAPRWKQEYYKEFWNWLRESVDLEYGDLEFIPIDESSIN